MKKLLLLPLSFILLFASCEKEEPEKVVSKPLYSLSEPVQLPEFNGENAYAQIEKQVSFGPRNPNSPGHAKALAYLQGELKKYADEVVLQPFTYTGYDNEKLALTNIIGKFNPAEKNRIILCAHWDTRPRGEEDRDSTKRDLPILGANDGGSGVGVLLEIARILKNQKVSYGIDIILFDGEDYGHRNDLTNFCIGSKYFSANLPQGYSPVFGILLDLVGDKEAVFMKEGYSYQFAPEIVNLVWGVASRIGEAQFVPQVGPAIYDDHVPLNQAGIRCINIIDSELVGADSPNERRNYWHTQRDTMDNIGKETLQAVGDVVIRLIYSLKFYN